MIKNTSIRILLAIGALFIGCAANGAPDKSQSTDYKEGYSDGFKRGSAGIETTIPHRNGQIGGDYDIGYLSGQYDGLRKFTEDNLGKGFLSLLQKTPQSDLLKVKIGSGKKGLQIYVEITREKKDTVLVAVFGPKRFSASFDLFLGKEQINKDTIALSSIFGMAVGTVKLKTPMNIDEMRSNLYAANMLDDDASEVIVMNLRWIPQ